MKFVKRPQESKYGAPQGHYLAKFVGVEERESEQYGPGVEWQFQITEGTHAGKLISRTTGPEPSMKNACGRMMDQLAGGQVPLDEEFNAEDYVGRLYQIMVEANSTGNGTRVGNVMPVPAQAPSRPPARPGKPTGTVKFWVQTGSDEDEPDLMTASQLQTWVAGNKLDPAEVSVCKEGEDQWKTAADFGVKDEVPF